MTTPRSRSAGRAALPVAVIALITAAGCAGASSSSGYYRSQLTRMDLQSANIITAEEIDLFSSATSVEEILERHSPGFWLRRRNEPGGAINVSMRGMGTPLFVVDGVPLQDSGGTLGLNPKDIETIEIWKDGGASAMWGMRGANGVILIRTKRSAE